eukprot:2368506-Pleurochrysis_carterae.AAC.1
MRSDEGPVHVAAITCARPISCLHMTRSPPLLLACPVASYVRHPGLSYFTHSLASLTFFPFHFANGHACKLHQVVGCNA